MKYTIKQSNRKFKKYTVFSMMVDHPFTLAIQGMPNTKTKPD